MWLARSCLTLNDSDFNIICSLLFEPKLEMCCYVQLSVIFGLVVCVVGYMIYYYFVSIYRLECKRKKYHRLSVVMHFQDYYWDTLSFDSNIM